MRRVLGLVLLAGSLAFLGVAIAKTYHRLPSGTLHVRVGHAVAAVLVVAVANSGSAILWRFLLGARGVPLGSMQCVRILSLSQLGKYLPGGFWQPLGWVGLARDAGVPAGVGTVSIAMTMALTVGGALLVGPVLLAVSRAAGAFEWLLALVPVVLVVLHPRVLGRALGIAARVTRRPGLDVGGIPFARVAGGLAIAVPLWFTYSAGVVLTAEALRLAPSSAWVLLSGAFAVAWSVGFLAVPLPGGLGVREAVLLLLLRASYTTAEAVAVAVAARLVFIVAEALMAGVSLAIPRAKPEEGVGRVDLNDRA